MCCVASWSSSIQLFLVRHPNFFTRFLSSLFYYVDLLTFGIAVAEERSFFRKRKEKLGWNFGAFGRLCVGEYTEVVRFLREPQVRGPFLGPVRLKPSRLPSDFLLFMDDPKDGEDPKTNRHQILHDYFFNVIVQNAQRRIEEKPEVFKEYVDKFIKDYRLAGSPRAKSDIESMAATLAIKYVVHALFDVAVTDEQLEAIRRLFYTGGVTESYLKPAMDPIGNLVCCYGARTKLTNQVVDIIESSPALENYVPTDESLNLSKRELAEVLLTITGTAGILGTGSLTINLCALFPREYPLDTSDPDMVFRAVLECARLHPPVSEFNAILEEEREFSIRGKPVKFPKGTEVCVVLLLSSYDPETFPDPKTFDPTRPNLISHTMTFNSDGFTPTGSGVRTCPGRNVAMKLNTAVLVGLIESEEHRQKTEASRREPLLPK